MIGTARIALAFTLALVCAPCSALAKELLSFSIQTPFVGCTGGDYWINLADYPIGAGVFPSAPSTIVGWEVKAHFAREPSYVMVGHTAPYGDAITAKAFWNEHLWSDPYAAVNGFAFDPAGDQLHGHYMCPIGDSQDFFEITLWYIVGNVYAQ